MKKKEITNGLNIREKKNNKLNIGNCEINYKEYDFKDSVFNDLQIFTAVSTLLEITYMFLLIILTKSNQIRIIKAKRILCKLDFEIDRMYKPIIIQSG